MISKSDSELKALNNTLLHLKARNRKFREYHLNKHATKKDIKLKKALEEQFNEIGDVLIKKKKSLNELKNDIESSENIMKEHE